MNCPLCHEPLAPGERWCDVCGTPAAAPPCPHCGGDVAVAERFCPHCGRPQPTPPPGAHGGVAGGVAPLSITISSGPAAAGGLGRPGVPGDLGPARARPAAALPAPPAAGVAARPPVPASRPVASAHRWRGGLLGLLVLGLGGGAYALFGPRPEAPAVSATPVSTSRLWVTPARPLPPRAAPGAPASPPAEQPPGLEASQVALAPAASPPDAAPPPAPVTPAAPAATPPTAAPPREAPPAAPPAVTPPSPVAARPAAVVPAPTPAQLATARRVRMVLRHARAAAPAPVAPPAPADTAPAAPPPPPPRAAPPAPPRPEPPRTREILARNLVRAAVTANNPAWDTLLAQLRDRRVPVTSAQTREARRLLDTAPQAATVAQGVERLRAAFAQHPGEPAIAAALVAALQAQQQGAAAETVAMEALGHEPERWENWVTLAQTAAMRDQPAVALAAYRAALRVADAPRMVVARLEALVADRGVDGRVQATAREALAWQTRAP